MVSTIVPILITSVALSTPTALLNQVDASHSFAAVKARSLYVIAQKQNRDPHGEDPHGDDPHDEYHDKNLPANKMDKARKAPTDPAAGTRPDPPPGW